MVEKLCADFLLERLALVKRQAVGLGDDGDDIDDLTELLHHNHVDRAKRVPGWVDEVEATMNARVLDVAVPHRRQLLTQVCTVLILDILDNGIPAARVMNRR